MAKVPGQPTQDEQIRHMQEQIRRLWTRMPPDAGGEPVESWQSLSPYLNAGWGTDGTFGLDSLHARFYKDRDRVYFAGVLVYNGGGSNQTPVDAMPIGYKPVWLSNHTLHTDPDNTLSSTREMFWTVEVLGTTGQWSLDPRVATPLYPPSLTYLYIDDLSYRIS